MSSDPQRPSWEWCSSIRPSPPQEDRAYAEAIGYKIQCGWSLRGALTATEDSEDKADTVFGLPQGWFFTTVAQRPIMAGSFLPDCLMAWDLFHSHPGAPQLSPGLQLSPGSLLSSDSVFPVHWPRLRTAHPSLEKNEHRGLAQGSRLWGHRDQNRHMEAKRPGEDHIQVFNARSQASTATGPSHPQNGQWGKVVTQSLGSNPPPTCENG